MHHEATGFHFEDVEENAVIKPIDKLDFIRENWLAEVINSMQEFGETEDAKERGNQSSSAEEGLRLRDCCASDASE
jgi:hypothetical protein